MAKGLNRKKRKGRSANITSIKNDEPTVKKRHIESKIRRYVIVDISTGHYLWKRPGVNSYIFVKSIVNAIKTEKRNEAYFMKDCYYKDTGDTCIELAIIPVDITYELIEENVDYNYERDIAEEILEWAGKSN